MKKLIIVLIIILILSVGANLYHFGWKGIINKIAQIKAEAFKNGQLNTINILFQQLQDTGQVRIQTEGGVIILVPLKNEQ